MIVAVGYPTVLVIGHIGSVVDRIDSGVPIADPSEEVALREADIDSAGGRAEVGLDQQDGSNLTRAAGYSCLRRTWKSLAFRVSSKRGVAGELPSLVSAEEMYVNLWL